MNLHVTRGLLLVCLVPVPLAFAFPADTTGTLAGRVVDERGRGIQWAFVAVLKTERVVQTDHAGAFRIHSVPPGRYTVRVRMPGSLKKELADMQVNTGGTTFVNVTLQDRPISLISGPVRESDEHTRPDTSRVLAPCPAPENENVSWVEVKQERFTFLLPQGFHEVMLGEALDSWARQFASADSTVFVTFDWGWYSDPLTGPAIEQYPQRGDCEERIGGRLAHIVSLWPLGAGRYGTEGDVRYGAGASWRDVTPGVHLTFFGWADDSEGLKQLLGIFRTVRFKMAR